MTRFDAGAGATRRWVEGAPLVQGEDRKAQADALYSEGRSFTKREGRYEATLEKFQAAMVYS